MKLSNLVIGLAATVAVVTAGPTEGMDMHNMDGDNSEENNSVNVANNSSMVMDPTPLSMHGGHHHGVSILQSPNLEPQQLAYWKAYETGNFLNDDRPALKSFLISHIALTIIAWCVLFPISVTLSGEPKARTVHFWIQTVQSAVAILALFCLAVYAPSAPADLYPGNAYGKMSIAMFFIVLTHWLSLVVTTLSRWALHGAANSNALDCAKYQLASMSAHDRPSHDSGHVGDSSLSSPYMDADDLDRHPLRPDEEASLELSSLDGGDDDDELKVHNNLDFYDKEANVAESFRGRTSAAQDRLFSRVMKNAHVKSMVSRLHVTANIVYTVINKPLFVVSFFYFLLGIVVFYRMGMANHVFNLLAHVIKGGIFFLFGLLTLARYMGAFASHGMGWNLKPQAPHYKETTLMSRLVNKIPSMEWIECFCIFLYGVSNVGLEHLGNKDGAWSHKDLQHASIAFMYIGGGLCGLLVETSFAKRMIDDLFPGNSRKPGTEGDVNMMVRQGYSFNPIAAFTVFWTGVLMSKHAQELPLSTEIHQQWGVLFCVAGLSRVLTYIIIYLAAPNTTKPVRPFTEIITAFCLICGGMVFIQSNGQTVEAMMYRGLDSMFSLNVNVGCAVLIMSWEMVVWAVKAKLSA